MFPGRNSHIRQHRARFIVKLQVTHIRHALTLDTELLSTSTNNLLASCQQATALFVSVNFSQGIYDDVVGGFPTAVGKAVSKKERDDLKLNAATLVYGEISFDAFGCNFF